ncbi:MAG: 4'-phosphopantetheinyl transferase superfamily protein [Clostridia bacterium]|nr:4'-phosphopantetheinyl transferase superfamily protein [Clostridia bacterium]
MTFASVESLPALSARYDGMLSMYRQQKLSRLKDEEDRARSMLAEFCLMEAVRRIVPSCPLPLTIRTEQNGKPFLIGSPLQISLSHAGAYAAAAVSTLPVGVDVERTRTVSESLVRRIATESEWAALQELGITDESFRDLFSAKESLVKRDGIGLAALKQADITKTNAVRQLRFADYVLSVASDLTAEWEVYTCGKDGLFCLHC